MDVPVSFVCTSHEEIIPPMQNASAGEKGVVNWSIERLMYNALLSESWYLEVYHIFENYGSGSVKQNIVK